MKKIITFSSFIGFIISLFFVLSNTYNLIYNYENLESWKIYALLISTVIFLILTVLSLVAIIINFKKVSGTNEKLK